MCEIVGQGAGSLLLLRQVENILRRVRVCRASFVIEPSVSAATTWVWGFDRVVEEGSEKRSLGVELAGGSS